MGHSLSQLGQTLGLPMQGPDVRIHGAAALEQAGPTDLSFLTQARHMHQLAGSKAGAVIIHPDHAAAAGSALLSQNPHLDFARALALLAPPQGDFGSHQPPDRSQAQAFIHPEARVHPSVLLHPFVFIGPGVRIEEGCRLFSGVYVGENCRIGPRSTLYPNVVLMSGTVLGADVIIHPGAVIGSDGFGYAPSEQGLVKVPQVGNVEIEDQVEIGANTTIDRAALGTTRIGARTKIDNLVQVGHNVQVGEHCVLVSQVGVAGSSTLGDRVTLAGQVGIADHLHLGSGCRVGAKSGVNRSLDGGQDYLGSPAVEARRFMRIAASWNRLPEMAKRLAALEKELAALKTSIHHDSTEAMHEQP